MDLMPGVCFFNPEMFLQCHGGVPCQKKKFVELQNNRKILTRFRTKLSSGGRSSAEFFTVLVVCEPQVLPGNIGADY